MWVAIWATIGVSGCGEFGISINTVGDLAANAYRKLGVHGAAAAVHAHRDAHFYCVTRVDFGHPRAPRGELLDVVARRQLLSSAAVQVWL